ncbi:helix-turn-helix domain-containing protein [Actinomadura sp. WMMA1423]|uniref:helix-turn-helix domain-containing protein n=1 Tax=Actinomadura sp. WMMA1423 TaxID=2591108 RepID=UPI001146B62C|nr:helix-turn-helix transcriptional regulator [Actinomadura sp. WMMA1423]
MEDDWLRLADYLVTERVHRHLDLRDLAAITKVSERTLGKIENGQRVSRDTLAAIELAFGWPPGTCRSILLGGQPPAAPDKSPDAVADGVRYPPWAAGDPFYEHIYRGPASDEDKLVAIRAVVTHREVTSGAHNVPGRRRA